MIISDEMKSSVPFQYAQDVLDGKIICGKYIKLAAKRFFEWIDQADEKGFYLDHKEAMFVIEWFPRYLIHTKGPLAKLKAPFILSPYQQFTIYNIFAWKIKGTNLRRINFVYETVGRKNGKTTQLSGLGLYCQAMDGEEGAEIYVGATKEAQAKTLWEQAFNFVEKSLKLRTLGFRNTMREIRFPRMSAVFRFLGGDSKTLDSLNPSVAFIDEYHAHKDDGVREVLESAMGARENPLVYIITTAGFNLKSVCKHAEDSYKDILKGLNVDDHTLIMIHQLDEDDDWELEANWEKANPNLQHSTTLLDFLRREFIKAKNQPSKIPNFKTKSLNMWVDGYNVWIPSEIWKKCDFNADKTVDQRKPLPIEKFHEFGSYAAVDLSTTTDITAFAILSEPDNENKRYLKVFLFCPEDTVQKRSKEDSVPYRYWVDSGFMIATPGNQVDYAIIEDYIRSHYLSHGIRRIEFDRYNSSSLVNRLDDEGFNLSEFTQTLPNYSHPTKTFESLVYKGEIIHEGNPVMEWMLSGCVKIEDTNENYRISKGKSHANGKRIDGIIASIMALGGSLSPPEDTNESYYNKAGTTFEC
ncbi:terminase large subunit [Flavobacterium sp. CYK-4]|uniref:terminase large subunit n=1 Tax=Flavobacterium lotistagni TaxID=2709660 RepID=UPI001408D8EF|nr:terminase TerL endonuclease subunit [Flavobacterium lotistagni]NHM07996.1 terminase large subunit [Flavobacterium lotistagni]